MIGPWANGYHTHHEVDFLRKLHSRKPAAFSLYADLVRSGRRQYDSTVDREAVVGEILRLICGGVAQ